MKIQKLFYSILFLAFFSAAISAQTEILTNKDVVLMSKAGLSRELIIGKIKDTKSTFDVSVEGLINLKNEGVDDQIIQAMVDNSRAVREQNPQAGFGNQPVIEAVPTVLQQPADAVRQAKTIAIEKSTLHPSRQELEKELLKRRDWKSLNLNIVRYKEGADLRVEIGRVPFSILTHRYVFRVYDNRSGTVIAAGETTSWGSLAENLARHISVKLNEINQNAGQK
jgi:SH3-like domain-containing protein